MICPHCTRAVKYDWKYTDLIKSSEEDQYIGEFLLYDTCANCREVVVYLVISKYDWSGNRASLDTDDKGFYSFISQTRIYPNNENIEFEEYIPEEYYEDYEESLKVLNVSPKSSAALSRRLLQHILREEFKIKKRSLSDEIQEFISLEGVPSHLTDAVDAISNISNFAAHPTKNKDTGKIVPVEPGEADWLIEIIQALFDFCFVQPKKLEERREELNLKLNNIGKPELKAKTSRKDNA